MLFVGLFIIIYIIFIRQWVLDDSDTVRYIIQERIERRDRQIARLDTTKKKEKQDIHKTKKRFYILNTIYHLYIYIYIFI